MIRIQDSVPEIYYNSSRDFQLLGHLFDLVLNSTKTEADLLFNLPLSQNSDDQLLDLMTFTLGLRLSKAKYTSRQLRAICSIAPKMMRLKGSRQAISLLCTALMRADAAEGSFSLTLNDSQTELTVYITSYATCRDALQEILPYILPAGMVFKIKESAERTYEAETKVMLKTDHVKLAVTGATSEIIDLRDTSIKDSSTRVEEFVIGNAPADSEQSDYLYDLESVLPGLLTTTTIIDPKNINDLLEETTHE